MQHSVCVLAGSVATSVFDSDAVLVGASGGVYALIASYLPSVFLVSSSHTHSLLLLSYTNHLPTLQAAFVRDDRTTTVIVHQIKITSIDQSIYSPEVKRYNAAA